MLWCRLDQGSHGKEIMDCKGNQGKSLRIKITRKTWRNQLKAEVVNLVVKKLPLKQKKKLRWSEWVLVVGQ